MILMMRNIQLTILLLTCVLCMSNSSCSKDSIEGISTSDFGIPFELSPDESVILPKNKKEVMISLVSMKDSRCPSDVQCIWAGNARIKLDISTDQGSMVSAELCIGQCDTKFKTADTTFVRLNDFKYSVILKAVEPYPGKGNPANKKALLQVKKI